MHLAVLVSFVYMSAVWDICSEWNLAGDIEWWECQLTGADFSVYDVCCVCVCGLVMLLY